MKSQEECKRTQDSFGKQIQQQNLKQKAPVMCGNRLEYCDPEAVNAFKQACENINNSNNEQQCINNAVSICYVIVVAIGMKTVLNLVLMREKNHGKKFLILKSNYLKKL